MKRKSFHSLVQHIRVCLEHSSNFCTSVTSRRLCTASNFTPSRDGLQKGDGSSIVATSSSEYKFKESARSLRRNGYPNGKFLHRGLCGPPASTEPVSGLQNGVEKEKVDCVVIGAGVVGIATAREIAKQGREVVVLEAAEGIGTGTSSRNSEVIHAGIYYPPGSLKARLCLEGKHAMYAYCKEREVPHEHVAKLIVATGTDQIPVLEKLAGLGKANGVNDLHMISGEEAMQLEPALKCVRALVSPSTGIVDSHAFMLALQTDAENMGVSFAFNAAVTKGSIAASGIELSVADTSTLATAPQSLKSEVGEMMTLSAKTVINAAGLFAQSVARRIEGLPSNTIPKGYYAKGCYFNLTGVSKPPFKRLIYPVPEEGGIGVHVTMDLGGQTRFGPDVEWLPHLSDDALFPAQFDYVVDPRRGDKFYAEIRKYYPALLDGALQPGYSGMRPKLSGRGQSPADFLIQGEDIHGIPGLIHLYGIESPGLTSSLGIAKLVGKMVSK
ncbi:unnamed protein product [Calypogeia fissa]